MYRVRISISIVLFATIFGLAWLDLQVHTGVVIAAVIALVGLRALLELFAMADVEPAALRWLGAIGGGALLMAIWADGHFGWQLRSMDLALAVLLPLIAGGTVIFGPAPPGDEDPKRPAGHPAVGLAWVGGGLAYVVVPMSFLLAIRLRLPLEVGVAADKVPLAGMLCCLYVIIVSKGADMGGYLVGKAFGKHKLIPHVSPNKSWEGCGGGLALTIALAIFLAPPLLEPAGLVVPELPWLVAIGCALAPLSLAGDLVESYLKRWAGVKDSGALIPEYGGILDLTDSLTFCTPAGYLLLRATLTT